MDTDFFLKNTIKTCRICLEEDSYEYISPCLCKGTQKYIHVECLKKWRNINSHNIEKRDSCEICKFKFLFQQISLIDYTKYIVKYNKYFFIEHLLIWIATIIVITLEQIDGFFVIRTLGMGYDSGILNLFKKENSYLIHVLFYLPFTYFLFEIGYMTYFNIAHGKVFKNETYKKKIGNNKNIYNLQLLLFLFYFYICFIINVADLYIFSTFFVTVYNLIWRLYFFKIHNKAIKTILIETQLTAVILSFEDNPLLDYNIEFSEKSSEESSEESSEKSSEESMESSETIS
jgi:hypothetical protein